METSKNLFSKSVEFLKGKYLAFIFFFFTPFIINFVFSFIDNVMSVGEPNVLWVLFAFLVQILLVIVGLLFQIGTLRYTDSKNNNQEVKIIDTLKNNWKLVLLFFILGIVNIMIAMTPLILLVIPGLVLSIIFQLAMFQLILKNKGLYSSIALSLHLVKGRVWIFIKKALYPFIVKVLPVGIIFFAVVGSSAVIFFENQSFGSKQIALLIVLGLLALALLVIIIRYALITYVYNYYLFLELEKTATPVVEEELQKTKIKLMWATALSPMIAIIVLFAVFMIVII